MPAAQSSAPSIHEIYQRASELAARGNVDAALGEVHYGLTEYNVPDLHLLAAILCQRAGRLDDMSAHVAAIPVDDSLRAEAEWLLRSQPYRSDAAVNAGVNEGADDGFSLDEIIGRPPQSAPAAEKSRRRWPVALAGLALVALLIVWFAGGGRWSQFGIDGVTNLGAAVGNADASPASASSGGETRESRSAGPVQLPTPTPSATPAPTSTISPDLVSVPTDASEVAGIDDDRALAREAVFELDIYLRNDGYDELAALGVTAQLQDGELALAGFVPFGAQREQLIEVAESVPGVSAVNATELYVRPPTTYIVQPGDTLWSITFQVYGDVERMEDVYAANRDQMASPGALVVGMELALPPLE